MKFKEKFVKNSNGAYFQDKKFVKLLGGDSYKEIIKKKKKIEMQFYSYVFQQISGDFAKKRGGGNIL